MITLDHITKTYPVGGGLTVLDDVCLDIAQGEYLGILGPSGSGKSTMLHIMGLLDRPTSGHLAFDGRPVNALDDKELSTMRGRLVGFVFQSFHLVPQLSVSENVELPLFYQGVPRRQRRARAAKALDEVGMSPRRGHLPAQLSGGERQRTAIARALVTEPALILADEPTGNLDSRTGGDIVALLERLHGEGRTIVMITHDRDIAAQLPRVVHIRDGKLEEQ
ncbi:MAG: ABC transporter ATP-binding protein [Verrucomicrobia bacterium]|nr:ABC transporter ATP-binding protein [Verrucomicrobiota bacterium]MBT7065571.1 ABC transporter ATP-binding protein [Verrucomicrobiota bacterium]MBT7701081.1 ABC transporter ATP-binding protein [Verrucomicrobiota bacterium]